MLEVADLPLQVKEAIRKGSVSRVEVDRDAQTWLVHLRVPEPLLREHLVMLAKHLEQVTGVPKVNIFASCSPSLSLAEISEHRWEEVRREVLHRFPSITGWLARAERVVEGNTLRLRTTRTGLEFLKKKDCQRLMEDCLRELYGLSCQVMLEATADQEVETSGLPGIPEAITSITRSLPQASGGDRIAPRRQKTGSKGDKGEGVLLGKTIAGNPQEISSIEDEERSVVVAGRVFNLNVRPLRSGRTLVTFDLTDNTGAISVKYFEDPNRGLVSQFLADDICLKVRGSVQHDQMTQELTVLVQDINLWEWTGREDHATTKRVELHLHTKMSSMDGITGIKAALAQAARWQHPAVAITDHGVVQAFPEAHEAAAALGLKVIYGLEGYLFDDEKDPGKDRQRTWHIVILVQNQEGLANLYRLVSLSHLEHFYRKPRIPRRELVRYRKGLLLGTACEAGELIRAYLSGGSWEELKAVASFYDYLEIQPVGNNQFMVRNGEVKSVADLQEMNRSIVRLGQELGKPVVATGDVHFLNPEDALYRQILMAGQGYQDEAQAPLFFRTTDEMLAEFAYLGSEVAKEVVVKNPRAIADMVEDVLPIPDRLYPPEIPGAEEEIASMAMSRAHQIYGNPLPEVVQQRVDRELNSIINNGFAVLYLIAHKLVKKSNDDGYLVGSRGSVGSSLVATLTGITEVNPLPPHYVCPNCRHSEFIADGSVGCGNDLPDKSCPCCGCAYRKEGHDIPFETFLGFKGDKVPDIDLNFSGEYQSRAHKYVEELFGREHVFRAGTIATIAERTAFGFVKKYLEERGKPARRAEIDRLVTGCTGVKRTTGQHPGGLMVLPKSLDIHLFTPVQYPADDTSSEVVTTHFDYHSISSRLVKLDILGHDDPTVIRMLQDITGVDPREIPLDDPQTMSLFSGTEILGVSPEELGSSVGTYGIPEFGTKFVRQMLEDTKPKNFSDLVRISGFSHGTDVWLNNAQDLIKRGIAKLSEAISTRDDIMTYLIYRGLKPDLAFKIMEDVRKGKGVKPDFEASMSQQGIPEWYIDSCKKIKYMFPKAHAVAYVTMAFRIAYCKIRFPAAFYASFFTVRADEFDADLILGGPEVIRSRLVEIEKRGTDASPKDKNLVPILEVALEMFLRGLTLLPVSLTKSHSTHFIIEGEGLRPPFAALTGVGNTAALNIFQAREEKPFTSVEDVRTRAKLSKSVLEVMERHGCLRELPATNQLALF
ncbi:DNA polymerase III subunit alpha [Clostridiales bacterium PH28_bin88]|nr:DNA polymerase III subunit alpha [Clostridiales bacterium PH28_bin88]